MDESEVWDYGRCAPLVGKGTAMIYRRSEGGRGPRSTAKTWDGAMSMQATKNPAALLNVSVIYIHTYKCIFTSRIKLR